MVAAGRVRDSADWNAHHVFAQGVRSHSRSCATIRATTARSPSRRRAVAEPDLAPDQVRGIARAGARAGCHEALFTLGERPELRYEVARTWLADHGYASTVDYLAAMCQMVVEETGLLPHANAGALSADELGQLRPVSVSQGMMIESIRGDLACHRGAPARTGPPARHAGGGRRTCDPVHHRAAGGHR